MESCPTTGLQLRSAFHASRESRQKEMHLFLIMRKRFLLFKKEMLKDCFLI